MDGRLLPDMPQQMFRRGEYHDVPVMIGVVQDEWARSMGYLFNDLSENEIGMFLKLRETVEDMQSVLILCAANIIAKLLRLTVFARLRAFAYKNVNFLMYGFFHNSKVLTFY